MILGLSLPVAVGLIGAAVLGIVFAALLVALRLRGRPQRPDIPPGMRPGPADEVLERRQLERILGWSVLFVVFFAAWMPFVWFREPEQNVDDTQDLVARSVNRGSKYFMLTSEENPFGFGCERCHGPQGSGGQEVPFTAAPTGFVQPPSLNDVCGRLTIDEIRTTIMEGRPGTPMPSWSVRFLGAMNDQQIADIINYLITIQKVPQKDNKCLNPPSATPTAGPTPAPSPS